MAPSLVLKDHAFADALRDRCSSVFACSGGHNFVDGICFPLVRKNMYGRFTFLSRLAQGEARDVERETEQRNFR